MDFDLSDEQRLVRETARAFTDNEIVAKQIVNVWYSSQFKDTTDTRLVDGGFYERGAVWPIIKAHPLGCSTQLHGYWVRVPSIETT